MHPDLAPDLILANGRVITADANDRAFEAVAVKMGRIVAVGDSGDMLDLRGSRTEAIDLRGRTVIPGLTDPHVHLADDGAASLNKIDVRDFGTNVRSIPHILEVVRAQAREVPPGTWIVGTGSPMQDFRMPEKRFPRREELDAAAPDHPVSIGFGAHVTIANSRALALAHVTKETVAPGGGAIELDPCDRRAHRKAGRARAISRPRHHPRLHLRADEGRDRSRHGARLAPWRHHDPRHRH